jgi:hypothetical protein
MQLKLLRSQFNGLILIIQITKVDFIVNIDFSPGIEKLNQFEHSWIIEKINAIMNEIKVDPINGKDNDMLF